MKPHFDSKLADKIRVEKSVLQTNKKAFQQLAEVAPPVYVARSMLTIILYQTGIALHSERAKHGCSIFSGSDESKKQPLISMVI